MNFVANARRHGALLLAVSVLALLILAGRAQAAELIYWNNYSAVPQTLAVANIDGSGGGALNLTGSELQGPEGMAIDTATGRLLVTSFENDKIIAVNLDGSGAADLNTAGAPIGEPFGLALDPVTRTVYWTDASGSPGGPIGYARLDGSGGGSLNVAGAPAGAPYRLALDPVGRRVYWGAGEKIAYANLDGSGGGELNLAGATPPTGFNGFAIDEVAGVIYWFNGTGFSYASLAGAGGGDVPVNPAFIDNAYGLAYDPTLAKLFWGNYGKDEERIAAIGHFANGVSGGINIATAPVNGVQDPQILKSPSATAVPGVSRGGNRARLSCTTGSWAPDYAGGFVWQEPTTMAYQWRLGGKPVKGATGPKFTATQAGSYKCAVTAANQAGASTATSKAIKVKAAKLKTLVKTKKRKAKPGKKATFRIQLYNQGDLRSKKARVCVKLPSKEARRQLKAPKCKKLGKVNAKGRRTTKVSIYVKPGATESHKVKFIVKGVPQKPGYGRVEVVG